ncbi:MAG: response regulator transcription factor [Gaiellales bacterium]
MSDRALTSLQQQVLAHLADGCADKEIAKLLGISDAGAKKHVLRLRRHYGVTNRVSVLRAAIELGDVELRRRD